MPEYIQIDENTYKEITTTEETIDLAALKEELARLEAAKPPTDKELIELGKMYHEYYVHRNIMINNLIAEIKAITEK